MGVARVAVVMCVLSACWSGAKVTPVTRVVTRPAAVVPAPEPRREVPRAAAVLADMARVYANAKTYVDHGVVLSEGTGSRRRETPFSTVFERPSNIRLEFGLVPPSAGPKPYVIWTIGSDVYSAWPDRDAARERDLPEALSATAGISSLVSLNVPQLLGLGGVSLLTHLADPSIVGEDTIDGHPCWQLTGALRTGSPYTLSIDESTFVLRRVFSVFAPRGGTPIATTITYAPTIDGPVDATQLAGLDIALAPAPGPPAPPAPLPERWIGVNYDVDLEVVSVVAGSPAEQVGMRRQDRIVAIDGQAVTTSKEVRARITSVAIGHAVHVRVIRNGALVELKPVVAKRPAVMPAPPAPKPAPKLDQPAPPFDVQVLAGASESRLRLADLAGHVVVLDFWATWCGPCEIAMPGLDALQTAHAAAGLRVIGISNEDEADIRGFLSTHKLGYAIALDASNAAFHDFGVGPIPMVIAIDKRGRTRGTFVGAGHDAEVEALVTTLLAE